MAVRKICGDYTEIAFGVNRRLAKRGVSEKCTIGIWDLVADLCMTR